MRYARIAGVLGAGVLGLGTLCLFASPFARAQTQPQDARVAYCVLRGGTPAACAAALGLSLATAASVGVRPTGPRSGAVPPTTGFMLPRSLKVNSLNELNGG